MKLALNIFFIFLSAWTAQSFASEPLVTGVSTVYLHSPNATRLAKWYSEALGIMPNFQTPDGDWTDFRFDGSSRFGVDQQYSPLSEVQKQRVIISFQVKDINKAVAEMQKKGVEFFKHGGTEVIIDIGEMYMASFKDLDGNFSQLTQPKAR